jgi:hypothetical protein
MLRIFTAICFILLGGSVFAEEDIKVYDSSYNLSYTIRESNGQLNVYDTKFNQVGMIRDGNIYDSKFSKIGTIQSTGKVSKGTAKGGGK